MPWTVRAFCRGSPPNPSRLVADVIQSRGAKPRQIRETGNAKGGTRAIRFCRMEAKRNYEIDPDQQATVPTAPPERALRMYPRPRRNPGIILDRDLVRALRMINSAVERRAVTFPTTRTGMKE